MIQLTTAKTDQDIKGILNLQQKNLKAFLSKQEIESQGFVTVEHDFELMQKLNNSEPHIIAKDGETVVGYVLSMTKNAKFDITILYPMFEIFNSTIFNGQLISDYNYIVVGQVCIDKAYRGTGLFKQCYQYFKEYHEDKYDLAITEIANINLRSLNAHKKIGFTELTTYMDLSNTEWVVVLWDWKHKL